MPDDEHIPGWPSSVPDGLGGPGDPDYEQARSLERRTLLNNVRHLAARVEVLGVQLKVNDQALSGLRRDNEQALKDISTQLDQNTVLTADIKDFLTTVRGGFKVLGWLGSGLKWLGALAAAVLAIWAFLELLKK